MSVFWESWVKFQSIHRERELAETKGTDLRARTMPSLSSTLTSVLNTIAPPIAKHEGFFSHGLGMIVDG